MRRLSPVPWLKTRPFTADVLLAAMLTAIELLGLVAKGQEGIHYRDDDVLLVLLVLLANVPVAWRRSYPRPVLALAAVGSMAIAVLHYQESVGGLGVLVALYSVAAHTSDRRRNLIALVVTGLALLVVFFTYAGEFSLANLISNYAIFGTAWILGDNLRTRRAYVASLEERADLAEASRAEEARQAVTAERARIARELHDVVAHGVSVMVVQAGAARRILERDPAKASEAMSSVEATGRQSLNELRRLLGVLRRPDDEAFSRVPQPSIEQVEVLVAQTRDAGLPVTLDVEGRARPLAPGVDLSAYRIVQEALTNALKHAGPAHATVRLCYGDDVLELIVSDDGRGVVTDGSTNGGHGLVGMQERVSLFGGELHVGNRPGGGFNVRATLPLDGTS